MSSRFLTFLTPNAPTVSITAVPPQDSGECHNTTSLYRSSYGIFALTWTRRLLRRTLRLHFRLLHGAAADLHFHVKPYLFWTKHGCRTLDQSHTGGRRVSVFWDLTRAEYGTGTDPRSGFYIAVVVDGDLALLVGDLRKQGLVKTRCGVAEKMMFKFPQIQTLRKENVILRHGYCTKARIGGREREILIDCANCVRSEDLGLCFSVDRVRVLQIKRLKWKFRGTERVVVDGASIQVSWDVYNWVFEDAVEGHAVFMFRFQNQSGEMEAGLDESSGDFSWSQRFWGSGLDEVEKKTAKKKKKKKKSGRSLSSSSLSSICSSGGSSSVMEWASVEENELKGASTGFSLLVYAWRS